MVRITKLSVLLPVLALCACAELSPRAQARVDRKNCEVAAFARLVSPALDASKLVEDLYAGRASMAAVLGNIRATQAELRDLNDALDECRALVPEEAPPAGDPS